jgi:alginate O-acetyltransferase complex protein AlgI
MNFAEARFWELLVAGLTLILLLRYAVACWKPNGTLLYDKVSLLLVGLALLFSVDWLSFSIFLLVAISTYFGLNLILKQQSKNAHRYLFLLIPLQLFPLIHFKYSGFLQEILGLNMPRSASLAIPVGISFYTFQKVAFVLDTLARKQPMPKFLDFMNFAGFFPQIVAGPIERRESLLPQMQQFRFRWDAVAINEGATWIALGFFFKCALADNLATCFDSSSTNNAYLIWLANLIFGLRIYYDFAGYSAIALGLARCLGVKLTLNFASPYCASSIVEFWRRWHVTLSNWFRDYLYIPLGGGKVKWWPLNVMLVFLVSGVWHGAGWNFLIWGALHGVFLVVNRYCGIGKSGTPAGWCLTMLCCFTAWLCFYEFRTSILFLKFRVLLTLGSYHYGFLKAAVREFPPSTGVLVVGVLAMAFFTLCIEWMSLRKKGEAYFYFRNPRVAFALVLLTIVLAPGASNGFIYFAF